MTQPGNDEHRGPGGGWGWVGWGGGGGGGGGGVEGGLAGVDSMHYGEGATYLNVEVIKLARGSWGKSNVYWRNVQPVRSDASWAQGAT